MPNGNIIYAAISMPANRQFASGTVAFTNLLENTDKNFKMHMETMPNGNYLVYDYRTMLLKQPTGLDTENNTNSYEAMANADGLYPVTQELYEFLVLHAKNNPPAMGPDAEYSANTWLAPCYYYKAMVVGTAEYPLTVNVTGDTTFKVQQLDEDLHYYFNIQYSGTADYTISIVTNEVKLLIETDKSDSYTNSGSNMGIQNITISANVNPLFHCFDLNYENREIEIVIDVLDE